MTGIIDAHHHIWRRRDLPWLDGPMQPRIFGPYEAIRRDYPISEFLSDLAGTGVTQSVYVQANWAKDRFEDEVAYVQQAADETGFPQGIVGYADFLADDVRPQLDRLTKYRGMRGVRMQLQWHENPQYRFAAGPDLARDPKLQTNVGYLADYGWSFDLQVFAGQMEGAAELAASCAEGHLHPSACRHARGSFAGGLGTMAERNAAPCITPEHGFQAVSPRHLHPQERSWPYRRDCKRNDRDIRRRSLPVRIELSSREIVDPIFRSDRSLSSRARTARRSDVSRRAS